MHATSKVGLTALLLSIVLSGCATERAMPLTMMPTVPKECETVLDFSVPPLPPGKTDGANLAVAMAKEGASRQQEHAISRVCAEYALRTAGVMKEAEAPTTAKKGVASAKAKAQKSTKPVVGATGNAGSTGGGIGGSNFILGSTTLF
jgi:hypothetical protein